MHGHHDNKRFSAEVRSEGFGEKKKETETRKRFCHQNSRIDLDEESKKRTLEV